MSLVIPGPLLWIARLLTGITDWVKIGVPPFGRITPSLGIDYQGAFSGVGGQETVHYVVHLTAITTTFGE